MLENGKSRKRRQQTAEEKWELFLEMTSQELSQADAARKWNVDVSTVIRIRRLARDAALAAFAHTVEHKTPKSAGCAGQPARAQTRWSVGEDFSSRCRCGQVSSELATAEVVRDLVEI